MYKNQICAFALLASLGSLTVIDSRTFAQGGAAGQAQPAGRGAAPAPPAGPPPLDPTKPHKLDITEGSKARYKVEEQLAGITFNSDAVGTTEAVTGTFVINPDGTIDAAKSKLTVDL